MATHDPPLDMFMDSTRGGRSGWAVEFIDSLVTNMPVVCPRVPDIRCDEAQTLRNAGKRRNVRLAMRTFEGQVWVCKLGETS